MSNKRKNFTLVELLTVIAIIAILAGLLFPVMGKYAAGPGLPSAQAILGRPESPFHLI